MEKYVNLVKKHRTAAISCVVVLVLIIGGAFYLTHRKVNIANDIELQYNGFNGKGSYSYTTASTKKMTKDMVTAFAKHEKLPNDRIDDLVTAIENDTELSETFAGTDLAEAQAVKNDISSVSITSNRSGYLSNGDTVKLSVQVKDSSLPIKAGDKTFKVHGLTKTRTLDAKGLSKMLTFKYSGYNKMGYIKISSTNKNLKSASPTFTVKKNGYLSNGDSVTVKLPTSLINSLENYGYKYTGTKSFTTKVSGLTDLSQLSNLNDVIRVNTEAANKDYDPDDNKVELLHTYALNSENSYAYTSTDSSDDDSSNQQVSLNESSSSTKSNLAIMGLYKITATGDFSDGKVTYVLIGYDDLKYSDGKVNIDSKSDSDSTSSTYDDTDSLDTINARLSSQGILLK